MRYDILPAYVSQFDIACIGETKIVNIPTADFPGFDIFSMKQKSKVHGLAMLIRSGLFPYVKKIEKTKSKCILWVALGSSNRLIYLIVGAVYIPCVSSIHNDASDFDIISEDIVALYSEYNCAFLLLGDFNSRTGKLDDFISQNQVKLTFQSLGLETERYNCDKKVDTNGRNLINLCNDLHFCILNGRFGQDKGVGQYTCIKTRGQSLVDYAIVSSSLFPSVLDFYIDKFDSCMSDAHLPVCVTLEVKQEAKKVQDLPDLKYDTLDYRASWKNEKKIDYQQAFSSEKILLLSEKITNQSLLATITQEEIDQLTSELTDIIIEPAKQVGLCKKIRKSNKTPRVNPRKSWFNEACETSRRNYFKAKNSIWKSKSIPEKNQCVENMKEKGKEYKQFISKVQKDYSKNLHKNLRDLKKRHPREYWKILKNAESLEKKEPKVPLRTFEKHFMKLNQNICENIQNSNPTTTESLNQEINIEFTLDELSKNIKRLNNNKSEGIDLIKNEYLKNCPQNVIELAVCLFNLILKTGFVPQEWCIGMIITIFKKKGSPEDPNNYRGITLLSCLGKLFTCCINVRLGNYLDARGIIGVEQAGFREGYSTTDHIFVLNELINLYLEKKKRLYCCFIDYQKAFDTINRTALWGKLVKNEINGKIFTVILNMYENAKSCVLQQTLKSGVFACNMGVRQGENLSPLLFSIFLNDFEETLSKKYNGLTELNSLSRILGTEDLEFFLNMYVLLYADDTLVFAESPEELQIAMHEVSMYCKRWGLSINRTKTNVVIFSRGKVSTKYNFKMGDINIETISEYCYLGVVFNFNGKFSKAISERIVPARKAMFSLNSKAVRLQLPPDIQINLFDKVVLPICMYGCEVWGYANIEPLEIFYRKFIKRVLGIHKTTPNCMVYGETGRYPMANSIYSRMIGFWIKISEGKASKLSSIIYKLIYRLHLNNTYHSPWLMKIKSLLCNSGNPTFWFNQEEFSQKLFMKIILAKHFEDQYIQEWNLEVNKNRKCVIYRIFKDAHCFENYLIKLNFVERRALSKFRTGNHRLPVAKSRYMTQEIDTKCKFCNTNDMCDEFHVLFVCKHFDEKRKLLIKKYYYTRPNTLKMSLLFANTNIKVMKNLANFTRAIMTVF